MSTFSYGARFGSATFSMAVDSAGKTLWVGSQPENKLSVVLTGRGG